MKKLIAICALMATLGACGTAQGLMEGTAEVLEGMGKDARSMGSIFD